MSIHLVLLRGINVGGKNKVPMADLRDLLGALGFTNVSTYIASGNAIICSDKHPDNVADLIQDALPRRFALDSTIVRVKVISPVQLREVIDQRPPGFGDHPNTFHSDVIFLMGIDPAEALMAFNPREGVDQIWPGPGVVYSQRLSAQRTKSRLNRVMASPLYQAMTIRNWNTTTKLFDLINARTSTPSR